MSSRNSPKVSCTALILHFAMLLNAFTLCVENVVAAPAGSLSPAIHRCLEISFAVVVVLAWLEIAGAKSFARRTWFSLRGIQLVRAIPHLGDESVISKAVKPTILQTMMSESLIVATIATVLSVPDFLTFDLIFEPRSWVIWSVDGYHLVLGLLGLLAVMELVSGIAFRPTPPQFGASAGGRQV